MSFTFMFSRPVKQAFICFRRNLFKLWQSKSIIVSFLSSSHLKSSLDHAQRWCWGGRRRRDLQEGKCLPPLNEGKRSRFMHCLHSNCINAALHPVTTKQRSHCSPCCSPSSGPSLSCFFIHPIQMLRLWPLEPSVPRPDPDFWPYCASCHWHLLYLQHVLGVSDTQLCLSQGTGLLCTCTSSSLELCPISSHQLLALYNWNELNPEGIRKAACKTVPTFV